MTCRRSGFRPALFLDGYARAHGTLFVSSWVTGRVYSLDRSGRRIHTVATFAALLDNPAAADGPADIAIDRRRDRLLVPLFNANELVIVELENGRR